MDETSCWYIVLHPPPRSSQEREMCDQTECDLSSSIDMLGLHNNEDEEEEYARSDIEGMFCEL